MMDPRQLTQKVLDEHHAFSHRELPILDGLFTTHADMEFRRTWLGFSSAFQEHMAKEEDVLFPAILAGGSGFEGPLAVMEREHDDLRRHERELRRLCHVAGPDEPRLLAFLDDLAEHARVEDEELFPAVRGDAHAARRL